MHSNLSQYYIGGEGSTGTPNLYYVINGRPIFEIELLIDSSQINLSLILDGLTKEEEKMYRWQKYSQKIKSNQP